MVFSSLLFLYAFLPLSLISYFLCRSLRGKNLSLLVFSLIFYAWGEPKYVLLLMGMALADWFCALRIAQAPSKNEGKLWLILAAAIDLGLIGFFKYAGLFCSLFGPVPDFVARIALPIGISFYTFQLLTYVADVYRGDASAEKEYWHVLLYAALFHQCIAGPIVRYNSIAEELFVARDGSEELTDGIRRFCVGLAKKALLANPCGALVDALLLSDTTAGDASLFAQNLGALQQVTVLGAWIGMAAFMMQIYLDFSAYSDMAIGLTGLWHGASWNFVLWGLYWFAFLMLERLLLKPVLGKLRILPHLYLLLVVYCGWILFRFTDVRLGWTVFRALIGANGNRLSDFLTVTALQNNLFLLLASAIACTPLVKQLSQRLERYAVWRGCCASLFPVLLLLLSTCALVGESYNPFLYFQF